MKSEVKAALIGVELGGGELSLAKSLGLSHLLRLWVHTAAAPDLAVDLEPLTTSLHGVGVLQGGTGSCFAGLAREGLHKSWHLPLLFFLVLFLIILLLQNHPLVYPACILTSPRLPAFPWMGGQRAKEKRQSLEVFAKDNGQETDSGGCRRQRLRECRLSHCKKKKKGGWWWGTN